MTTCQQAIPPAQDEDIDECQQAELQFDSHCLMHGGGTVELTSAAH